MSMIPELMGGRSLSHPLPLAVGKSSSKMYVGGQAHAITAQAAKEGSTYDTSVQTILGSYTIPANSLVAGSTIRVRAVTRNSDQNGSDALQVFVSLGANTTTPDSNNQLLTTNDATVADGDFCVIDGAIQIRTIGATATGYAMWTYSQPSDQAVKSQIATALNDGTAAVDTTADLILSIDSQWSANHDDNDVELEMFIVDIVNPGV